MHGRGSMENERRARITHEMAIRLARLTAQLAKDKVTRETAAARLAELEASYAAKYAA
jgi:hypothetical protein